MEFNMASMRAVFISILLSVVCGFTVLAEEEPSRTKDLFEGVWLELYPGEPYDVSDAYYLIIWRVDDNYILIGSSTLRPSGGAGVLFPSDDPSDGRMLDGGDVVFELDENDTDILYKWFKESAPIVESPDIGFFRRFTSVDLDQLEAFWAERR